MYWIEYCPEWPAWLVIKDGRLDASFDSKEDALDWIETETT